MSEQVGISLRCTICGSDQAEFVCYVCNEPVCEKDRLPVAAAWGARLPFPVHYCRECQKKERFKFLPHTLLGQQTDAQEHEAVWKKVWYWVKRV